MITLNTSAGEWPDTDDHQTIADPHLAMCPLSPERHAAR